MADYQSGIAATGVESGGVEIRSNSTGFQVSLQLLGLVPRYVNTPPTFSGETPTGAGIAADAPIQFSCSDDVSCNLATLTVDFEDHLGVVHRVYEASNFVAPYTGTCVANGTNGYDFELSHDPLHIGNYEVTANVSDGEGDPAVPLVFSWTVTAAPPTISGQFPAIGTHAPDVAVHLHANAGDWELPSAGITLTINGVVVLAADTWTVGYNGTVTSDGDNWLVTCSTHPPWPVGALSAQADLEDEVGATATDTWGATVEDDPPTVAYQYPVDYSGEPDQIRLSVIHEYGVDPATLSVTFIEIVSGAKVAWSAVVLGVVDPDHDVNVLYQGSSPTRIDVVIRSWPMDLSSACRRVEAVVDATSITGVSM